jgi:hypothetical protein
MVAGSLPRILVVLCASNQLYSGTGTALFNWIRTARHALDFTVMIDTHQLKNAAIAARVCQQLGGVGRRIAVCSVKQLSARRDAALPTLASPTPCRSGNPTLSEPARKGLAGLSSDAGAIG